MLKRYRTDRNYLLCSETAYVETAAAVPGNVYVKTKKIGIDLLLLDTPNQLRLFENIFIPWCAILLSADEAKTIFSEMKRSTR